jgi:hypothetical protein
VRLVAATAFLALVIASPAAAITGGKGVYAALHTGTLAVTVAGKDGKLHSCQAGDKRATGTSPAGQTERKAAVVACEQPPRSNLLSPNDVAKATAAALSVLG